MSDQEFLSAFDEFIENPLVNDRVLAAVDLISQNSDEAHYSLLLHSIVDDFNLEDHHFDLTDPWMRKTYIEVSPWERSVFDTLKDLSERERVTVVAIETGRLDRRGNENH